MSNAYLGPYPNVAVTVSVTVGGQTTTRTVNVPNTDVFNVTQQAMFTEAPTDLRTAQRSLTFAEDPRFEVREADYPGYTVAVIERAIQQETSPDSWSAMEPTATATAGTRVRFRTRAQVYDAGGVAYEAPVDLFSDPLTVVAHTAPGDMTAGSVTLTSITSQSGMEAQALVTAYPATTSSAVHAFDYSIDAGTTTAGTVQKSVGATATLVLAANTPDQVVHVRARDADGAVSANWVALNTTASTGVGAETVVIRQTRTAGINPCGIAFAADASGFGVEDHFRDLRYLWRFDDPGHYTRQPDDDMPWDRVVDHGGTIKIIRGAEVFAEDGVTLLETQNVAPAVLAGATYLGPDSNIAYGPRVVHVFPNPGTYNVTCEVLSKSMALAGTPPIVQARQIVVSEAYEVVSPSRVYCVRGSAPAGEEPVGAQVFTSYADAFTAYRAQGTPMILAFRRGQSFDTDSAGFAPFGNTKPPIFMVDAYGPEADGDPVLSRTPKGQPVLNDTGQFVMRGIKLATGFDATDPYSIATTTQPNGITLDGYNGEHNTVWDCDVSGFWANIISIRDSRHVVIGNTLTKSWLSYGIFFGDFLRDSGLCGVWSKQPVGTKTDPVGNDKDELVAPFYPDHGPFRCSLFGGAFSMNACGVTSLNSWFAPGYQPCIRLGGSDNSGKELAEPYLDYPLLSECVIDRVMAEYGTVITSGNFAGQAYPRHDIYDKIYHVNANGVGASATMALVASGPVIRNVMTVIMDQPNIWGDLQYFVNRKQEVAHPENSDYGIDIFSNTFADLRRDAYGKSAPIEINAAAFTDFAYFNAENNIFTHPNRTDDPETYEPLSQQVVYQLDYPGYYSDVLDPSFAVPADTPKAFSPLPGSAGYQTATTGKVAIDDFWGKIRPANASMGAMEPV